MNSTKKTWDTWELIAIKYLQKHNYKILDTNFKFGRFWEVDLICEKGGITVFVEVKYRLTERFGKPEEAITKWKLHKCRKTIEYFCVKNRVDFEKIRFDAIAIMKWEKAYNIKHFKNIEI